MENETLETIVAQLIAAQERDAQERDAYLNSVLLSTKKPAWQDNNFVKNIPEFAKSWRALETISLDQDLLSAFVKIYAALIKEEKKRGLPKGIDISAVEVFLPYDLVDRFTVLTKSNLIEAILNEGITLSLRGQKLLQLRYPDTYKKLCEKPMNIHLS